MGNAMRKGRIEQENEADFACCGGGAQAIDTNMVVHCVIAAVTCMLTYRDQHVSNVGVDDLSLQTSTKLVGNFSVRRAGDHDQVIHTLLSHEKHGCLVLEGAVSQHRPEPAGRRNQRKRAYVREMLSVLHCSLV